MIKKTKLLIPIILLLSSCGSPSINQSEFDGKSFAEIATYQVDTNTYTLYGLNSYTDLTYYYKQYDCREYLPSWSVNIEYKATYNYNVELEEPDEMIEMFYTYVNQNMDSLNDYLGYSLELLKDEQIKKYQSTLINPTDDQIMNAVSLEVSVPYRVDKENNSGTSKTYFISVPFYITTLRQYSNLIEKYDSKGEFMDYSTFSSNRYYQERK